MTTENLNSTTVARSFGAYSSTVLEEVVLAASDLCLFVSAENTVEEISRGGALDDLVGESWIGQPLRSVISKDSWRKLDLLLDAQHQEAPVWRHLNFIAADPKSESVPLLVRWIDAQDGRAILVCRDLRPSVQMQKTFTRALNEMVQSLEDTRSVPEFGTPAAGASHATSPALQGRAKAAVDRAIDEIGHLPLAEIVMQTSRVLEDVCIQLAYVKCDYDLTKTADLLGLSSDELALRIPVVP